MITEIRIRGPVSVIQSNCWRLQTMWRFGDRALAERIWTKIGTTASVNHLTATKLMETLFDLWRHSLLPQRPLPQPLVTGKLRMDSRAVVEEAHCPWPLHWLHLLVGHSYHLMHHPDQTCLGDPSRTVTAKEPVLLPWTLGFNAAKLLQDFLKAMWSSMEWSGNPKVPMEPKDSVKGTESWFCRKEDGSAVAVRVSWLQSAPKRGYLPHKKRKNTFTLLFKILFPIVCRFVWCFLSLLQLGLSWNTDLYIFE